MPELTELTPYEQLVAKKVLQALPLMNAVQKSYFLGAGEMILMQHKPDPDDTEPEKKPA